MFASKYLDKEINYKREVFSSETTLHRLCKPLILHVYVAHTAVAMSSNTQHSDG